MDKDKAMEWVKALRSGKYKQGKKYLKVVGSSTTQVSYCCLGVLGEISGLSAEELVAASGLLPDKNKCGLKSRIGDTCLGGIDYTLIEIDNRPHSSLAAANDSGCTFDQIADWIENNYDKL